MEKSFTYRDSRLRSAPLRLLNAAGATLNKVGVAHSSLDPERIMEAAMRHTGLVDLGDDSVVDALHQYLHSVNTDANLNTLGRIAVKRMLVNALSCRLQVIDWTHRHPDVLQETIDSPWIVIGLPRTGTSLLSILLGLDPLARPLLQWEARHPIPPSDLATANEDPRIALFAKDIQRALAMNPPLAAMHPFGSTLAEECTAVFLYALRTIGMESIAFVPSYGAWLDAADMAPAYAIHKQVLQALQHAQPTQRWVLKSPNHLWSLDALHAAHPNARIVWTHRDPAALVPSLASLNSAMQMPFTDRLVPETVGEYWASKVDTGIRKAIGFDEQADANWCCHIQYQDLISDPKGTLKSIYEHFGDSPSDLHQRRVATWLKQKPKNAHGSHRYDPQDFGWSKQDLKHRYQHYRDRFHIPSET